MYLPLGDRDVPYHDAEAQSKRLLDRLGRVWNSVRCRSGPEAKFENNATAFLAIHSGRRISDEVLAASATRRCQPLEAW